VLAIILSARARLLEARRGRRWYWLASAWVVLAAIGFGAYAQRYHPFGDWLTFFWARAWAGALLFGISSLAIGVRVLALFQRPMGRLGERFTFAMALGVLTFALGVYVAGLFGLLRRPFFFAWPALLLLVGGRALVRDVQRIRGHLRRFGPALYSPRSALQVLAVLLLVAGVLGLYLEILVPGNISFDARWYHLPIAENYAVTGRIRPFPEGWYKGCYPHLASWLYTWAFLAPGALDHQLCLASHIEFVVFLATLAGVSALAHRLIVGIRIPYAAAALFLFPAIFCYDSNLNTSADHVLGFWAAPLGLALIAYLAEADRRRAVLLGTMLGAAALTKHNALFFFVAPIGLVLVVDLARRRRPSLPLVVVGVALAVSTPHWLKNVIAHGDPLYPTLYRWFPSHPFFEGAGAFVERFYYGFNIQGTVREKLRLASVAMLRFSFSTESWGGGAGRPGFGALFTLLLPLALLLRPRWRALVIVAVVHAGVAIWYLTNRQDRFLQAILPLMAAVVAAILARAWQMRSVPLRAAVALLVGFQVIWGGDVYFLRDHLMLGESSLKVLVDYISAGHEKKLDRRQYPGQHLVAIGASLPRGSRLVAHDFYQTVGVGVPLIADNPAWQGTIDYLQLDTPQAAFRAWRRLRATHLVWPPQKETRAHEDLARDAVFARAAHAFARPPSTIAGYRLAELLPGASAPAVDRPTRIAWLACGDRKLGLYTPAGLVAGTVATPLSSPALARDPASALADANAFIVAPGCSEAEPARSWISGSGRFTSVMQSGDHTLWVR
jgi:hypothetical protein